MSDKQDVAGLVRDLWGINPDWEPKATGVVLDRVRRAREALTAQNARIRELEEALRPFADDAAELARQDHPDRESLPPHDGSQA